MQDSNSIKTRPVLVRAIRMMEQAHEGQMRKSGEKYSTHPRAVYAILVREMDIHDLDVKVAALLHDVVEDTSVTLAGIRSEFGEVVSMMVDVLTKPKLGDESVSSDFVKDQYFKRFADAPDAVKCIKAADRIHNLRTMACREPDWQKDYLLETIELIQALNGCSKRALLEAEFQIQNDRVFGTKLSKLRHSVRAPQYMLEP